MSAIERGSELPLCSVARALRCALHSNNPPPLPACVDATAMAVVSMRTKTEELQDGHTIFSLYISYAMRKRRD